MILAGLVEAFLGVKAERKGLEELPPLERFTPCGD
jgi:hypothetical protein